MTDPLKQRQQCQEELYVLTQGSDFVLRYALLYAVECLELRYLDDLVDAVRTVANDAQTKQRERCLALLAERYPQIKGAAIPS